MSNANLLQIQAQGPITAQERAQRSVFGKIFITTAERKRNVNVTENQNY